MAWSSRGLPGVADLAVLVCDPGWLVSLRATDVIEKLAHQHVDWVQPYPWLFIGPLADRDQWKIRLQIVRASPAALETSRTQTGG